MKHKQLYIAAISTAFVLTSVFTLTALAENRGDSMGKSPIKSIENMLKKLEQIDSNDFSFNTEDVQKNVPSTMTINPQGNIRITNGKVTAVSGDAISVEIWKLNFSVQKMPDTRVLANRKQELTFAQIAVGDMVGVLGQIDTTTSGLIHAQIIHDRSRNPAVNEAEKGRLQSLITELIQKLNAILRSRGQAPLPTPSVSVSPSPSLTPSSSPSPSASASPSPSPSTS